MGNKICKPKTIKQAKNTFNELVEYLSCGEPGSDDEGPNEVQVSPRKFVEQRPGGSPSYAGMAGSPVPVRQHHPNSSPQHQQNIMPGESCVVTYDVGALGGALGHGGSAAFPGQSMVVTGSSFAPRGMEPASPPVATASKPQLQSTQSFDVECPYKAGDQIQIWSTSQQKWCNGTVDKAQGEWVHISYKGAEGRPMSKIMPNGHEHLQHAWSNNVAPPRDPSLPSSAQSPQKGLAPPSSPGAALNTSGMSGFLPNPPAAVCTYKVGDDVEIWSTSQNTWCRGRVDKAEGEWVHISYKGPSGQPMTKLMPNGHEELRFPSATYSQPQNDFLTPVNSTESLPPPPPPATASYQVGDRIEIWSTSQNAWRPGSIGKVDGDWVHVNYQGPGGPMNKIMPNGHAHLRLQAGFAV